MVGMMSSMAASDVLLASTTTCREVVASKIEGFANQLTDTTRSQEGRSAKKWSADTPKDGDKVSDDMRTVIKAQLT